MHISELAAYEILEEKELSDIHSTGYRLRHKKSGARITVILNDDENKVFYIGFRTPPKNSTGVPHIMEHSVLCGSEKYPLKDPFVELVKGSLNTFLNAMTYPDKTLYPVASCNDTDFDNLMDVYMDAVLHPNIYKYREIFEQEGWHYELEEADAPLTVNGVVYNEMKGAFSSPDDMLGDEIVGALFPDTVYAHNAGGDPKHIPELSYEEYLEFHRKYYHPSNSYIYLYGDMDIAKKLQWLDEQYLSGYESRETDSAIPLQKPFAQMKEVIREYPVATGETEENQTYLSYNVAAGTLLDATLYQALDILDYALVSAPGAPVKKALLEAGIGKDISGGHDYGTRQMVCSIVAKNTNLCEKERFLAVIFETLRQQVRDGIDKQALRAGISSLEFRFREADYGQFPKGLLYGIICMDSWLYDEEKPFLHLEALSVYRYLKEQIDTGYFEDLVQKYFLDNPHAALVAAVPKKGLAAERDEALRQKLAAYKASLSEEQKRELMERTKRLREYQDAPTAKEDLAKLPMLKRGDLKKKAAPLCNQVVMAQETVIVHHPMYANGIDYLTFLFDIRDWKPEELAYLGILKNVLGYVDTEQHDYAALANEINQKTGGIGSSIGIYPHVKERDAIGLFYEVRVKTLAEGLADAMRLTKELLLTSKLTDEKRLYEILGELKSRLALAVSSYGHIVASTRATSYFSRAGYYQDALGGIAGYRVIADYEEHFEEKKVELIEKLQEMVRRIFTRDRLMVSVTCEEKDFADVVHAVEELRAELYEPQADGIGALPEVSYEIRNEGFMDASQVQYVARAGNYAAHGYAYHGALRILKVIMGYEYLWSNVRVKGGAYGCMNQYLRNGDVYFVSYRDPNLAATNEVYEKIPDYVRNFMADEDEMTKYIIGTVSDLDAPLNPSAKGARSMTAYLQGLTYEEIQKERDEILGASDADIRAFGGLLEAVLSDGAFCVVGGEEVLRRNSEMFLHLEPVTNRADTAEEGIE